ncbi:hypothetical protein TSUD_290060 [Trifolium subterraneum]|uniref:Uncharacterized protein n=1 Tax=Trifolium subterraneum TaxID=3900 RepID=A0A2Z6NRR0_TRISU|nr:hypothetical protein TSUD_290060 [Trifolium subterraneum]
MEMDAALVPRLDGRIDGEAVRWWFSWRKTNQNVKFYSFEKALLVQFKLEFGVYLQVIGEEEVVEKEPNNNCEYESLTSKNQ